MSSRTALPALVEAPLDCRDVALIEALHDAGALAPAEAFAGAVRSTIADLNGAIQGMNPDDITVDLTANQEANGRTSVTLKLRAYRRNKDVAP